MDRVKWIQDPMHSEVTFKIKHLMITNVSGRINEFDIEADTADDAFNDPHIKFTADVNSITTNNEDRDKHLRSSDFFDAENHPKITFVGKRYESVDGDGSWEMYGDLTIRGTTKEVRLDVEFGGVIIDAYGNTKAGFTINGKIRRSEYGLVWNAMTEAGGIVVSDEVRVSCEIQLVKQN